MLRVPLLFLQGPRQVPRPVLFGLIHVPLDQRESKDLADLAAKGRKRREKNKLVLWGCCSSKIHMDESRLSPPLRLQSAPGVVYWVPRRAFDGPS